MVLKMTTEMLFLKLNEEKNRGELLPLPEGILLCEPPNSYANLESETGGQPNQKQAENTRKLV